MSALVQALDEAGFEAALGAPGPLVVDFWAPWCAPCRTMAPVFEAAAARQQGRARFASLNTDEVPAVARRFNVRGIPTLVLFNAGREIQRVSGVLDARALDRWMDRAVHEEGA